MRRLGALVGRLWAHGDFLRLWLGQTVSEFGAQITSVGLPLTAALWLHATPWDMGVLGALSILPFLLIGLFVGVYVDRRTRRPLLVMADAARALTLLTVPVLAALHALRLWDVDAAAFVLGAMTVLFDVAYQSYLPSLVSRERLTEGNSKLEATRALSQVAGPGVGGFLAGWIGAPFATLVNVGTYLVSVGSLLAIRTREPVPRSRRPGETVRSQIAEGLRFVLGRRDLRSIAGCTSTGNFFANMGTAVFVLFALHRVGLTAGLLGLVYAGASLGGVLGAVAAGALAERRGVGLTIALGSALAAAGGLLLPLAPPHSGWGLPVVLFAHLVTATGATVYNITQVTLRQRLTVDRLLGRMNASMRFIVWGSIPIGSMLGGWLGGTIGLRPTLWVAGLGGSLAVVWILRSPVLALRAHPQVVGESAGAPL